MRLRVVPKKGSPV